MLVGKNLCKPVRAAQGPFEDFLVNTDCESIFGSWPDFVLQQRGKRQVLSFLLIGWGPPLTSVRCPNEHGTEVCLFGYRLYNRADGRTDIHAAKQPG